MFCNRAILLRASATVRNKLKPGCICRTGILKSFKLPGQFGECATAHCGQRSQRNSVQLKENALTSVKLNGLLDPELV